MLTRALVAARTSLVRITTDLATSRDLMRFSDCLFPPAKEARSRRMPAISWRVGAITATSFMTAIEEPDNFKNGDPYQSGLLMETKLVRRTSNRRTISNDTT